LVEVLGVAGLSLDDVFKRVRERVYRESQGRQLPWVASNVLGEFYFRPGMPVAAAPAVAAVPAVVESPVVRKETAVAESPRAAFPAVTGNLIAQSPRDGLAYVGIVAGSYRQGCTANDTACYGEEKPARAVKLTRPFWMGQTEVTVRAYRHYAQQGRMNMPPAPHFNTAWAEADQAMVNVTWDEARMFCEWTGGRLPTEAEWEYAARGGVEGWKYPWGNTITHDNANYGKEKCCGGAVAARDQWLYAAPVGKFERNRLQLYDMAGNVAEWVKDWFAEAYAGGDTDPAGPASGDKRVVRGGSWLQNPWGLRLSARMRLTPGTVSHDVGFRCVVDGPR
jgi:formylglycine-generating enzyme required for sulfatase activity